MQVIFDLVPLRILPSILVAIIVYPMAGLQMSVIHFLKFSLALIMFNMTSATLCLMISTLFNDPIQTTLVSTTIILGEMLFGGLLLNSKSLPPQIAFINQFSFFNCALEAMVVNEVNGSIIL